MAGSWSTNMEYHAACRILFILPFLLCLERLSVTKVAGFKVGAALALEQLSEARHAQGGRLQLYLHTKLPSHR
ncbi:hypothetical protein E4U09_005755 [Claviceps aff. purpurea]|uniref:Secreted protein n=1 Tax=Claviceps aff. purpurea TaxID=1967640 RepID=A0A9P7QG91_9HYPO|nr:hypothetical protein E4U09_005755 [Claviceps aff. purpurea]